MSLASKAFHLEYNLRIKTSHRFGDNPLLVHAVWWEVTGDGEGAAGRSRALPRGGVHRFHDQADHAGDARSASLEVDQGMT